MAKKAAVKKPSTSDKSEKHEPNSELVNQIRDVLNGFRGCGDEAKTSVSRQHCICLAECGVDLDAIGGTALGNGAYDVPINALLAELDK